MKRLYLTGKWNFKEEGADKFLSATVPGEVHLDLLKNNIIDEPLIGLNAQNLEYLEGKIWIYEKNFTIPKYFKFRKAELVFEGIDHIGKIFINEKYLGITNNSFISHCFDVTRFLSKDNKIQVMLNDGLNFTPSKDDEKYLPHCGKDKNESWKELKRIFLRKPQFYFGWDWTQRLINCGIWRDVYLNFYQNLAIRDLQIYPDVSGKVAVEAEIENFSLEKISSELKLHINQKIMKTEKILLNPCKNKITFSFEVKNPKLWFPWNIGEPYLYNFVLEVYHNGTLQDTKNIDFGFRKVEVIQKFISKQEGTGFTFKINGINTFAKGANWVPADTIIARVNNTKYKKLINYAKEMGSNMLRIWGGGIYENPYFYQLCDKAGIMLWQDFMYACAYYPDDKKEFIEQVEKETEWAVKNLRNHPSIVLWCGNNENNVIYYHHIHPGPESEEKTKNPKRVFYGKKIYHKILPEIVKKHDKSAFYWPSSPYSPSGDDPQSMIEGDRHSWYIPNTNLFINGKWIPGEKYTQAGERYFFLMDKAKFVSEFGRLGLSNEDTIKKATNIKKLNMDSPEFKFHLNTMSKNKEVFINYLLSSYGERIHKLSPQKLILFSQLWQAENIYFALSYYNSRRFITSGTLFWMFNDSWPTSSSWTAVDYYLKKTPVFWYAKRAFQKIGVFICPDYLVDGNKFRVFLWNEKMYPIQFMCEYGICTFQGEKTFCFIKEGKSKPNSSILIGEKTIPELSEKNKNSIIYAKVKIKDKTITAYTLLHPNWKKVELPKPNITVKKVNKKNIEIKSDSFVMCCVLKNVETQDNFFHLLPNIPYRIEILKGNIKIDYLYY
jgi:beta-mannosidase